MIVPLGIKAYSRSIAREIELENLYLEKDESGASPDGIVRVKRPGFTVFTVVGAGPIRALDYRVATGQQIAVSGSAFYYGGALATGTVPGVTKARLVETAFTLFVLGENTLQYFDGAALQPVVMPNDALPVVDIEQILNYLLILTIDGRFYWIEPGATVVDPLNFATAESSADYGVALARLGDEFMIFGTETTEFWQPTGDQDAPFQRSVGRNYERGCIQKNTVCRFDNGVIWVSNGNTVCRVGNVPQIISDNAISDKLQHGNQTFNAFVFSIIGHEFYVLTIFDQGVWVYDASTQAWSRFRTLNARGWRVQTGYTRNNETFFGSSADGTIWKLDPDGVTDAGTPIRVVTTGMIAFTGPAQRNDSFTLAAQTTVDASFDISWRDGQDDYGPAVPLTIRAPYDAASIYRLGQPDQPYRQVRVASESNVGMRILGAVANGGWK